MLSRLSYFLSLALIFFGNFNNPIEFASASRTGHQAQTSKDPPIKLQNFLVNVEVSVIDRYERSVAELTADNFEVYDNGVKQTIGHFSGIGVPIRLGIVFDSTGSMKEKAGNAKEALKFLLHSGHSDDRLFLICLKDGKVFLAHDYTFRAEDILTALTFVNSEGSTPLYDAVYLAIEKANEHYQSNEKMAIVIISDGQDNNSRYTFKELRDRIRESGTLIYSIGVIKPGEEFDSFGRSVLEEITRISGGRAFFPTFAYLKNPLSQFNSAALTKELSEICWHIATELHNQYSLGYYPTNLAHDGKTHKIKIKLVKTPKGLGELKLHYLNSYQDIKD